MANYKDPDPEPAKPDYPGNVIYPALGAFWYPQSTAGMLAAILAGGDQSQDVRRYYDLKESMRRQQGDQQGEQFMRLDPLLRKMPSAPGGLPLQMLLQRLLQRRQPAQGPEPFQRPFRQNEP